MKDMMHALVLESETTDGLSISRALAARGMRVDVVDCCAKAMNKMLEYMDLVVVDSRAQGVASLSVETIKTRVATTPVVAVAGERELKSLRCQGRLRADAYVALSDDSETLAASLLAAVEKSARGAGSVRRGRMAHAA